MHLDGLGDAADGPAALPRTTGHGGGGGDAFFACLARGETLIPPLRPDHHHRSRTTVTAVGPPSRRRTTARRDRTSASTKRARERSRMRQGDEFASLSDLWREMSSKRKREGGEKQTPPLLYSGVTRRSPYPYVRGHQSLDHDLEREEEAAGRDDERERHVRRRHAERVRDPWQHLRHTREQRHKTTQPSERQSSERTNERANEIKRDRNTIQQRPPECWETRGGGEPRRRRRAQTRGVSHAQRSIGAARWAAAALSPIAAEPTTMAGAPARARRPHAPPPSRPHRARAPA